MDHLTLDTRVGYCDLLAPAAVLRILTDYLSPLVAARVHAPLLTVEARVAPGAGEAVRPRATALGSRLSHPTHRYTAWQTDGDVTLLPATDDHIVRVHGTTVTVEADNAMIAARVTLRVVRQFILRGAEARGGLHAHAAVLVSNSGGVLVAGRSGAGKTTVMTSLVERHGWAPVANDRAVLLPDLAGWLAVGVPLAWRYTPEGAQGSERLRSALRGEPPLRRGDGLVDGKMEFTPHEACTYLRRKLAAATLVSRIVILGRAEHGAMDHNEGLASILGFGTDDPFVEDWIALRDMLGFTPPRQVADTWRALGAAVPVEVHTWTDPTELAGIADVVAARVTG